MIFLIVVAALLMTWVLGEQTPVSTENQQPIDTTGNTILSQLGFGVLSPSQIAQIASDAGFAGNDLITAVAIAMAESGGNPNAYNAETAAGTPDGKGSYGLWQIYLNAHPEFAGDNLYDPPANANAAYSIYSRSGFKPWSTYKSGAYQAFLDSANAGVNA